MTRNRYYVKAITTSSDRNANIIPLLATCCYLRDITNKTFLFAARCKIFRQTQNAREAFNWKLRPFLAQAVNTNFGVELFRKTAKHVPHHANKFEGTRIADTIKNPVSVLAGAQYAFVAQNGKMLGNIAL